MGDLSPHFSAIEFRDHITGAVLVDEHLVTRLEVLRHLCGDRPLKIVSGFRSSSTNAAVGGAKDSQHLVGRAADIPPGYATVAQCRQAGFTGVGYCGNWAVHVDVRAGRLVIFPDC